MNPLPYQLQGILDREITVRTFGEETHVPHESLYQLENMLTLADQLFYGMRRGRRVIKMSRRGDMAPGTVLFRRGMRFSPGPEGNAEFGKASGGKPPTSWRPPATRKVVGDRYVGALALARACVCVRVCLCLRCRRALGVVCERSSRLRRSPLRTDVPRSAVARSNHHSRCARARSLSPSPVPPRFIVTVSYFKDNLFVRAYHVASRYTLPYMLPMSTALEIFGVPPGTLPHFYPGILHADNHALLGEWLATELSMCRGYLCTVQAHAGFHRVGKPALMLEIIEVRPVRGAMGVGLSCTCSCVREPMREGHGEVGGRAVEEPGSRCCRHSAPGTTGSVHIPRGTGAHALTRTALAPARCACAATCSTPSSSQGQFKLRESSALRLQCWARRLAAFYRVRGLLLLVVEIHFDKAAGREYYFNRILRSRTFTKPRMLERVEVKQAPDGWATVKDAAGLCACVWGTVQL
jgi:hypothetical protein